MHTENVLDGGHQSRESKLCLVWNRVWRHTQPFIFLNWEVNCDRYNKILNFYILISLNVTPGATTSVKEVPSPFLGTPVTLYPVTGPWAGLHLTVTLLSFTVITSISEGELMPERAWWKDGGEQMVSFSFPLTGSVCASGRTCLVHDVDRCAGCGTVSSARYSVDGDDVVSTGLQIIDCCSRLRSRNCELFWITVPPWTDPDIKPNCQTVWFKEYILKSLL